MQTVIVPEGFWEGAECQVFCGWVGGRGHPRQKGGKTQGWGDVPESLEGSWGMLRSGLAEVQAARGSAGKAEDLDLSL